MGARQDTGPQATPGSSTQGATPGTQGASDAFLDPRAEQQIKDLCMVQVALEAQGGASTQKLPDLDTLQARKGQELNILDAEIDFITETFSDIPVRPQESTLKKLTQSELLPPPFSYPVPFDLAVDANAPEFVAKQRIEFLVLMKHSNDSSLPWGFPDREVLQALFSYIKTVCDHDQIMEAVQWIRVDAANIATIMLSSINLALMNMIRHAICSYQGHDGFKFETYAKAAFVKKYGLTMYIPKDMADYATSRILRTLAYKYPALRARCGLCTRQSSPPIPQSPAWEEVTCGRCDHLTRRPRSARTSPTVPCGLQILPQ